MWGNLLVCTTDRQAQLSQVRVRKQVPRYCTTRYCTTQAKPRPQNRPPTALIQNFIKVYIEALLDISTFEYSSSRGTCVTENKSWTYWVGTGLLTLLPPLKLVVEIQILYLRAEQFITHLKTSFSPRGGGIFSLSEDGFGRGCTGPMCACT